MHHLDSWIKRDQLDVTCFIISLFTAQHVSDVNIYILRSLRLICWVTSWVVLLLYDACWCYVVVWLGWCGIRMQVVLQPASGYHTSPAKPQRNTNTQNNTTHEITQQISRKLLRVDVLTSEIRWALNNEIKKQVTSSWSLFIQAYVVYVSFGTYPFFVQNLLSCCVDKFGQKHRWSGTKQVSNAYADVCQLCTYEQCVINHFKRIVNYVPPAVTIVSYVLPYSIFVWFILC